MKRKRLLLLTPYFPPEKNGLSQASFVMAQSFAKRGYDVTVATTDHAERAKDPDLAIEIADFAIGAEPGHSQSEADRLTHFLKQDRWDWIVIQGWLGWPFHLASPLLAALRAKSILVSHGFGCHRWQPCWKPAWGLWNWLKRQPTVIQLPWLLRRFDWVTFLSPRCDTRHYFDQAVARLTGFDRHSVIPNGVDARSLENGGSEFRKLHGIPPDHVMFLYVAYYSEGKNQALAASAFRRANLKNSTLVLIGGEFNDCSQAFQEQDQRRAGDASGGRILWLEKVPRALTCSAFTECDAFVMTSKFETQPIVLLEAMAAGKPFISTDVGCASDLPGGIIAQNENQIAQAMRRLATDAPYAHALGTAGRKAFEESYALEKVMDAYECLFLKLHSPEATA